MKGRLDVLSTGRSISRSSHETSAFLSIDKSEQDFPDSKLIVWKREHTFRLTQVFGAVQQTSRQAVLAAINPLLVENYAIFEDLNPNKDYKSNPESESASAWQRNMRGRIIPNNRRILAMLDANRSLMIEQEAQVVEQLRQHVHDLEARHFTSEVAGPQKRFPGGMSSMMRDD